jgi:GMP synthase-like glutamine amidotransferase
MNSPLRVQWFQHVPFEGLGRIEPWLRMRGHTLACTAWHAGGSAPAPSSFDWLIVMGGSMNIYQHRDHPWLVEEKRAIGRALEAGKRVLGVCLGSQLIADVLGAKVFQNPEREVGWWPVHPVAKPAQSPFALEAPATLFHWHGDTFSPPPGAVHIAASEGCAQQAFAVGPRVLGLQCHLEIGAPEARALASACAEDLRPGRYVQGAGELVAGSVAHAPAAEHLLHRWLAVLERG